jgi:transglutaminase-like putative cysteine protease
MITRVVWPLLVLLMGAANSWPAVAAERDTPPAWVDPGWRRTVVRYAVTFDERGLSTTVFDFEILALDPKGAEALAQKALSYNSYYGDLTVSDLATVKADGNIIAVDPRAVRDQPASADASSPAFGEERNRLIAYPDVAPGDKVKGRAVYRDKRPRFGGEFERFWVQPEDQPPEVIELTLEGPASKPLRTAGRNVEHSEERSGNRIIHHVRLRHDTPVRRQTEIDEFDTATRFEASTFTDYSALAAALNALNAPMATPNEALRAFAAQIAGNTTTTAGKVERLHNWVAQNIRYAGVGLEDGGLTSQPAATVLASRYGDCKAMTTLLKALLAAQDIDADLVLVNARPRYLLTEAATQNFDHAILYVPALDQYLDPTASRVAFGALPSALAGKPVLDIDTGRLGTLPMTPPERFSLSSETDTTLLPDGTRDGRTVFSGRGLGAALSRDAARRLEEVDRRHFADEMLTKDDLSGRGDYAVPDPRKLSDSYAITATFQVTPVKLDAPLNLPVSVLSDPRLPLLRLITGGVREEPFRCQPLHYRETAALRLPDGVNLTYRQAPVTYAANFEGETGYGTVRGHVEVNAHIVADGRTIRSDAEVQIRFDKPVCPAEFVNTVKLGLSKFNDFRRAGVGLIRKPVGSVIEISRDYTLGTKAFRSKNYHLALTWLRPLADQGHASAQSHVGYMYEYGCGVARDYREAMRWYLLAAEQGDPYSQASLAEMYEKGWGVAPDDQMAAQWYGKAADLGDRQAQLHFATMYRDGRGVKRDLKQAEKWFGLAADQGSAWAEMSLGVLYTRGGDGLPLDYNKAIDWFRKAAERDEPTAEYNLGWAYEAGLGVAKDLDQAIEWYHKAADHGDKLARRRLDELNGNSPSAIAARVFVMLLKVLF